jgi:hypothetical protein
MAKTIQVRLPAELVEDAALCARAFGESTPAYVARLVRDAVRRDLPRAAKLINKRAEQAESRGEADE